MTIKNLINGLLHGMFAILLGTCVLSCGGGGDSDSGGASGQSGSITLTTDLTSIPADGSSSATITAAITDSAGNPVRHYTEVTFTTNLGHFRNGSTTYTMQTQPPLGPDGFPDPDAAPTGVAQVQLIAGTTAGAAKVTCNSNGVTNSIYVSLTGVSGAIVLTASPSSISADGSSSSIITATLTDSGGNPVNPGTPVSFKTSLGYFQNDQRTYSITTPDSTGVVRVSLIAGYIPGTSYIVAKSNDVSQSLEMTFTNVYASELSMSANPIYIEANGTSTSIVTAHLQRTDESRTPIEGTTVTFYLPLDPEEQGDPLPADNTWSGNGSNLHVTPEFYSASSATFIMTYKGGADTNFSVDLWNVVTGKLATTLINTTGPVTDQSKTVSLGAGNYYFRVTATGEWRIEVQGSIGPTQEGTPKVLGVEKTDGNGDAEYEYTSTLEVGAVQINAVSGEFSGDIITDEDKDALRGFVTIHQTDSTLPPIELEAASESIYANGENSTEITASVRDAIGAPVADGTVVTFDATLGTLSNITSSAAVEASAINPHNTITETTVDGVAKVKLTATASANTVKSGVTATVGSDFVIIPVTFIGVSLTDMKAVPEAIFANGTDKSVISIRLQDADGIAVAGETIAFTTSNGTLVASAATTDSNGNASVELVAPTKSGVGRVTASYGTLTAVKDVYFEAVKDGSITLTAVPPSIPADGSSTSVITATIKYSSGEAVPKGTSVKFITNLGTFSDGSQSYTIITPDETGVVSVSLTAGTTPGSAKVTASAISITQTIYVGIGGDAVTIKLAANPTSIPADGISSSTITATLTDSSGAAVTPGTQVKFTTDLGTFSNGTQTITVGTPDATGVVSVSLISSTTAGAAEVTATSNGVAQTVYVTFGGGVGSISVAANPTSIPADGTSSSVITATLKDSTGSPVTAGTSVKFTTDLGTFSNGTTTITVDTPDGTGVVSVSLIAGTTAGTAQVDVTSGGVSASVYVVIGGSVGSITLAASPTSILADGASSSAVTATVKDSSGNPVNQGTSVTFTTDLGTFSNGTTTITAITADATGVVTVSLIAGTTPGTATVTVESSGVTQSITVTFSGQPAVITVTASPSTLPADGTSTSSVEATVLDSNGNPVADGETLNVTVVSGTVSPLTATTTAGVATVTYTTPASVPQGDSDTVTFTATNGVAGSADISLTGPQVATVVLKADPPNLPADGTSQSTITATVTVSGGGSAPEGTPVDFTVTGGGYFEVAGQTSITKQTNASGVATVKLTAGTSAATASISATSSGVTAEPISLTYQPGSITLTIIPNSLLATGGATAEVTAELKDVNGSPAPDGETVNFSLDDTSLGSIPRTGTTSGGAGKVIVEFTAASKGGTVTITATWNTGGTSVTGTGDISIQSPPAFIEIAEGYPDPQKINIKGTGGVSNSQLKFNVKDIEGNLVTGGYRIDFTIVTGPNGGESLIPASTSTSNGQVSTLLYSGLKSGPVSIKAAYHDDSTISTTASQVVIVGGPAVGEEFGISAAYLNVSGLWVANLKDAIGINAADLYGNAIADNTAISFKTYNTGGFFETGTAVTTGGVASDNLVSGGTYLTPLNGFLSATAEVVGGNTTRVSALALTPGYSNIIYAGTNGGGVYKSIDSGATWTNISRSSENPKQGQNWIDPYVKGNSAISVETEDPNVVYVGTGYLGKGALYRSKDGGMNWNSNNLEQWEGLKMMKSAVLTVLCDDSSPYVWFGTEGEGFYLAADGENFVVATSGLTYGTTVNEAIKVPGTSGASAELYAATPNGVFYSPDGGQNWTATGSFVNNIINTIAIHPVTNSIIYAGTESAGVWVSTNSGTSWAQYYPDGMGKGLSASVPVPDNDNTGNGTMSAVTVATDTQSEFWAVTCTAASVNSGTFKVEGSVSGLMTNIATVGTAYTSDNGEVSFTLSDGSVDFSVGDNFTFTTSRDPGSNIKDLLVDSGNDWLYAITYYFGPLEPYHAVGNVYVHTLEATGAMTSDDWTEAVMGLPEYSPPNDTTLFAQNVMVTDNPDNPGWFLIGGEGINLYKAGPSGLVTGTPAWESSKLGLSNLIMARMPILFSGNCTMSIDETDLGSNVYRYTVYIEDKNGNPPISDSEFAVTTWDAAGGFINTVKRIVYADVYTHQGTFSNPADATTNNPYEIDIDYSGLIAEAKFLFTPNCLDDAPGCSGSEQELTYSHQAITTPSVTTTTTTALTANTASSGGNVTNDGGSPITARGVCWNTTGSPDIYDSKTTDGTGTGTFTSSITGLTTGNTYYVRAYATNSVGTGYGSQRIITTP